MSTQVKKELAMGPQEDLQEVRSVFVSGSIGEFAAGVPVKIPLGFTVLVRIDASQNFNDLRVHAMGRDNPVVRCLYRIGTPYTCFVAHGEGSSQQKFVITGTPAGACDMNIYLGKFKPGKSGACD